ncbi:MerC domain-containing protein [Brevundimonas sp.]|uniref:MerC domain-containing protein n=1 Tax=Brevundimonas sp. TaxID=1871086 RepID=UPI0025BB8BBB|nr:MerC domain-containing protein [Brevundimonas sp.]
MSEVIEGTRMTSTAAAPRAVVRTWGDIAAIGLSIACLAHCLALPVAAAFLPMLGLATEAAWAHWAFVAVAAPLSIWTLAWPPRGALRPLPLSLAVLGLTALVLGAAEWPSHEMETPMTVVGALLLSAAHVINLRRRRHRC